MIPPIKNTAKKYDIVTLGANCVDINAEAEHEHLTDHSLKKGLSNIVSSEKLKNIIENAKDMTKTPGGPGANVAMGVSMRGGKSALIGKVANDKHGTLFTKRIQSHGVDYTPVIETEETSSTTAVLVLTTPDKERTFAFSGKTGYNMKPEDIDEKLISQAKITYLDSYLWFSDSGKKTIHHTAIIAKQHGSKIAIAINDADLIVKNREAFLKLVTSHADILVGDKNEFMALFSTHTLEETISAIKKLGCTASITAGASGAHIVENDTHIHIPSKKVDNIVDTCGAGDQFAAGFLYGLSQEKSAEESGHIAAHWASEIIQHKGAEPKKIKKTPKPPFSDPKP